MKLMIRAYVNVLICFFFFAADCGAPLPLCAQPLIVPPMPAPGAMAALSPAYKPAQLQGVIIHPDNALRFDFLMQPGEEALSPTQKKEEYNKLIKYFMASLTIADKDQWVNLSPYEKSRIVPAGFGKTEMGRDLLAQDYLLKQITSSLMFPESGLGKKFWEKVYSIPGAQAVALNVFNKVWIVPDKAVVYESGRSAVVLHFHLKVMLEEDYLAGQKHMGAQVASHRSSVGSTQGNSQMRDVVRQTILPVLEREVNEGKNFAALRQMVSAMILATWYKKALKESVLSKYYVDKAKVKGVDLAASGSKGLGDPMQIYARYLNAFKKGAFNFIKEDIDRNTHRPIPRKYFAGGFARAQTSIIYVDRATIARQSPGFIRLPLGEVVSAEAVPVQEVEGTGNGNGFGKNVAWIGMDLNDATIRKKIAGDAINIQKRFEKSRKKKPIEVSFSSNDLRLFGGIDQERRQVQEYLSGQRYAIRVSIIDGKFVVIPSVLIKDLHFVNDSEWDILLLHITNGRVLRYFEAVLNNQSVEDFLKTEPDNGIDRQSSVERVRREFTHSTKRLKRRNESPISSSQPQGRGSIISVSGFSQGVVFDFSPSSLKGETLRFFIWHDLKNDQWKLRFKGVDYPYYLNAGVKKEMPEASDFTISLGAYSFNIKLLSRSGLYEVEIVPKQDDFNKNSFTLQDFSFTNIRNPQDSAMALSNKRIDVENIGGIDLTGKDLAMDVRRQGEGIDLPLSAPDLKSLMEAKGLYPRILRIFAAADVPILNEIRQLSLLRELRPNQPRIDRRDFCAAK